MAFDDEFVNTALGTNIRWNPDKLFCYQFNLRNGQDNLVEGLEGDAQVVAIGASNCAFELAMHKVDDNGL